MMYITKHELDAVEKVTGIPLSSISQSPDDLSIDFVLDDLVIEIISKFDYSKTDSKLNVYIYVGDYFETSFETNQEHLLINLYNKLVECAVSDSVIYNHLKEVYRNSKLYLHLSSGNIYELISIGNTTANKEGYEQTASYVKLSTNELFMRHLNEFGTKFKRMTY